MIKPVNRKIFYATLQKTAGIKILGIDSEDDKHYERFLDDVSDYIDDGRYIITLYLRAKDSSLFGYAVKNVSDEKKMFFLA